MNKLQEIFLNFEKAKSKYLITLLDNLHGESFELPSYKIKNFAETLEKEVENYNKYNKAELKFRNELKSDVTTIKVHAKENDELIELCSFEMKSEPEVYGVSINDIANFLKSLNEKELKMSAKRRDCLLKFIEDEVFTYCIHSDDIESLNLRIERDPVDPYVFSIMILQKVNDDYQVFSHFNINEI